MSEQNTGDYSSQLRDILEASRVKLSSLRPSEWAEQNIIMPKPFPGPLRYEKTPYTREIIDRFAPDDPARDIALMGSAQFGKTASIIIPVIGYIIANDPGNIIMTVGHDDLVAEAMDKIESMLDTTGLRKLIRPSAKRAKNQKTGDTNTKKEFPNGYLKLSAASNPKIWRQVDYKFGLLDDFEAVRGKSKEAGDQRDLIEKRFTAYNNTYKRLYVSSPERLIGSNINAVYLMGDQRKFMVPCPLCSVFIELKWSVEMKDKSMAGITWKVDDQNNLITDSVGYICQECGGFFTDQHKSDFVNRGYWQPTAKPFRPDFLSYHMSSLYSPHGMSDWKYYAYKWIEAHPPGRPRDEKKYQTFINLNLGEPYEDQAEAPKANQLQENIRNYAIGTIPEKMSIADGNGKIVLITLACDLNGTENDARLDYEILAWSENMATYSVMHGSIGTFVPREGEKKIKEDRERWTYEPHRPRSVWPELERIIDDVYVTDSGKRMKIIFSGIDTGHYTNHAYYFIDKRPGAIVGLKGKDIDKYIRFGIDLPKFRRARERDNLYLVEVNEIKDDIADLIKLQWEYGRDEIQPPGFMNYPTPSDGKYLFTNFFSHYEAEHKVMESKDGEPTAAVWRKKDSQRQNHFWDVRVYHHAVKDIFVMLLGKQLVKKESGFSWSDYVCVATTGKLPE